MEDEDVQFIPMANPPDDHNFYSSGPSHGSQEADQTEENSDDIVDPIPISPLTTTPDLDSDVQPNCIVGTEIQLNSDGFDVVNQVGLVVDVTSVVNAEEDAEDNVVDTETTEDSPAAPPCVDLREDSCRSDTPSGMTSTGKRKFNMYADGIGSILGLLVKKVRSGEDPVGRPLTPDPEDTEESSLEESQQPSVSTPKQPKKSPWAVTKSSGVVEKHQNSAKSHGNYSSRGGSDEMRQLMRKKMYRCTICKNRFIERDLFERHTKEKHPKKYEVYMEEKNKREEKERLEYLEFLRIQREKEERRNQRLAEIYEERLKLAAEGHNVGPPPLPEEIFPHRPPRPRSRDEDIGVDAGVNGPFGEEDAARFRGINIRNSVKFNKKVSPQCPFCDKRYRNDNSLRKHIAKKHPDCINFVQCNRCYKALRNADEIPGHHCDLMYICNECQPVRNMVDAERLYNHKQKFHRGEKSGFLCVECNRKFLTPRKLKKHQRMAHVIQKPYKCQFCDEYFPTDMQVCAHERIHTGKVRWECPMCDYRCNRSTKLLEHKKNEHGYLCMLCGEPQPEWNNLKNHTLEKHQGYLSSENQNCVIVSPRIWTLLKGE